MGQPSYQILSGEARENKSFVAYQLALKLEANAGTSNVDPWKTRRSSRFHYSSKRGRSATVSKRQKQQIFNQARQSPFCLFDFSLPALRMPMCMRETL